MTREEWKERAAARYAARLGVHADEAAKLAQELYNDQDGEFCSYADYNPEWCADDDIDERACADGDDDC